MLVDETKAGAGGTKPAAPAPGAHSPHGGSSHGHRRWMFVGAAILVAAVAGVFFGVRGTGAPRYVTARVERGDIDATVTTTGNLNAVITVQVGSQVSGNIIALYADFNTKVKKGQLVAEIDPAPFQAAVDQATASLVAARAGVVTAEASLAQARSNLASASANVASQKANVVKAQSAVDLAKVANERRQIMVLNGSTSQEDADTAKATYDQAVASMDATKSVVTAALAAEEAARQGVEVAQAQLQQARAVVVQDRAVLAQSELNLSHTKITAPVDGTVESRNMDVGQTVAASFQAPTIFLIAQDLTRMQVDTNVDEADVSRVHLDQPATFTVDAWPGVAFRGRVAQIRQAPINVQNVITYDIVVQVSNEDLKLFPGMTANVVIAVGHAARVLKLPKSALRFRPPRAGGSGNGKGTGNGSGSQAKGVPRSSAKDGTQMQIVSVVDGGGQLKQIPIRTGLSDANFVEIVSGDLAEGQQVVIGTASPGTASGSAARPPGLNKGI